MTQDIHQSLKYGRYMKKLGWIVEKVNHCQLFIRRFPLLGSFIKIQRPNLPISFEKIEKIAQKYRAFKITIEPTSREHENTRTREQFKRFCYKKSNSPYLPTKTIYIDLTQSEEKILGQIEKRTRNTIHRAQKKGVTVEQSKDIKSFIQLKARYFWPLPFLITKEIKALWQTFYPKNAVLLRTRSKLRPSREVNSNKKFSTSPRLTRLRSNNNCLAGVLLLFHQKTAHYWLAASTKKGQKLCAPTLLVWEAIKLAKKRGHQVFDFQGIYDPRFHQATKKWQGFSYFKKGFGGKEIEYPGPFIKHRWVPF